MGSTRDLAHAVAAAADDDAAAAAADAADLSSEDGAASPTTGDKIVFGASIAGATLGACLAGPLGAIVGLRVGGTIAASGLEIFEESDVQNKVKTTLHQLRQNAFTLRKTASLSQSSFYAIVDHLNLITPRYTTPLQRRIVFSVIRSTAPAAGGGGGGGGSRSSGRCGEDDANWKKNVIVKCRVLKTGDVWEILSVRRLTLSQFVFLHEQFITQIAMDTSYDRDFNDADEDANDDVNNVVDGVAVGDVDDDVDPIAVSTGIVDEMGFEHLEIVHSPKWRKKMRKEKRTTKTTTTTMTSSTLLPPNQDGDDEDDVFSPTSPNDTTRHHLHHHHHLPPPPSPPSPPNTPAMVGQRNFTLEAEQTLFGVDDMLRGVVRDSGGEGDGGDDDEGGGDGGEGDGGGGGDDGVLNDLAGAVGGVDAETLHGRRDSDTEDAESLRNNINNDDDDKLAVDGDNNNNNNNNNDDETKKKTLSPSAKDICCICMESEAVVILPCYHSFCETCIDAWVASRRSTCPLCRGKMGGKNERWQVIVDDVNEDFDVKTEIGKTMLHVARHCGKTFDVDDDEGAAAAAAGFLLQHRR